MKLKQLKIQKKTSQFLTKGLKFQLFFVLFNKSFLRAHFDKAEELLYEIKSAILQKKRHIKKDLFQRTNDFVNEMDLTYKKPKIIDDSLKKNKHFIIRELEKNNLLFEEYSRLRTFLKNICIRFNSKQMKVKFIIFIK